MNTHASHHRSVLLAAAVWLGACASGAFGQATMQGGYLEVASTWKGTQNAGYTDVHDSSTKTHGPTTSEITYSSLPLSLAYTYAYDYNANNVRLVSEMGMNWGSEVSIGSWDFTYSSTQEESFHLANAADWVSTCQVVSPFPYTYFWLDDVSGGGPSIDLLTVHSGSLPAGDYRWRCHAEGAWTTSDTSFLYGNGTDIVFSTVPSPAAALVLGLGGVFGSRRRR